jgi:hypothetical protein
MDILRKEGSSLKERINSYLWPDVGVMDLLYVFKVGRVILNGEL